MAAPFTYGKIAIGSNFTNRVSEIKQLESHFVNGIHTILISPRRWGKTSLVQKAAATIKKQSPQLLFCFLDLNNVRSEQEFYELLASAVLKASYNKLDEILLAVKTFLSQLIPKLNLSPDAESDFSLSLDWDALKKSPELILNMAEKIAQKKKVRFVICIDEFQNISEFTDPISFQKKLRANWQKHQLVSYCLYGSKRHMMIEVFATPSMPFYKFGELMFLEKIATKDWETFIVKRFKATKKNATREQAHQIAILVENHPYYTQQLAQQCWLRTDDVLNEQIIAQAHEGLTMQLSLLFQGLTNTLTKKQLNFLKALSQNEQQLSSAKTLKKYNLGTSANVLRIKRALLDKEVLDNRGNRFEFLDPVYKHWLKHYFFKTSAV